MTRFVLFASAVLSLCGTNQANAQMYKNVDVPAVEPGPFYHHASTIQQGYLDGCASVIRAHGLADYNHALAARYWQMANEHSLINSVLVTKARFERKLQYKKYRRKLAGPPMTLDRAERLSQQRLPARLSTSEFNPEYDRIHWPVALHGGEFARARSRVEQLFRERTTRSSGCGTVNHQQIHRAVSAMEKLLCDQVQQHNTQLYLAARKFLAGLKREADFAIKGSTTLALADGFATPGSAPAR